jgi:hypothetical protein
MPAREAVRTADLATTDLESMTDAELRRMLGSGSVCRFGTWRRRGSHCRIVGRVGGVRLRQERKVAHQSPL